MTDTLTFSGDPSATEPIAHGSLFRGASVRPEAVCGD